MNCLGYNPTFFKGKCHRHCCFGSDEVGQRRYVGNNPALLGQVSQRNKDAANEDHRELDHGGQHHRGAGIDRWRR